MRKRLAALSAVCCAVLTFAAPAFRGLVEAYGGRIWAENRPEGGARVAFTLPSS
jgi:hypothetical protein